MYVDKDNQGKLGIYDITPEDAKSLETILFDFECPNRDMDEVIRARLLLLSAKIRFGIIDSLKIKILCKKM